MPGLLSLGRSGHRQADDGDQTQGASPLRRLVGNRFQRHAAEDDVEMNATAAQPQQSPNVDRLQVDNEPAQGPSHDRQGSGRSFLSQISIPSLSALRLRDRDAEMVRQARRAEAGRPASPTPDQLENGRAALARDIDPHAAAAASVGAGPPVDGTAPVTGTSRATSAKRSGKSRREREEAATLFGPNLANYFGSGNSTSGAVTNISQNAAAVSPNPAATSPDPATSAVLSSARQARLGSRGRARGASLSGLSMLSLAGDSVTSLGAYNTTSTDLATVSGGIMDGSTYDLISQVPRNDGSGSGEIAMSEGIDMDILKRWIDKSAGSDPGPVRSETPTIPIPPVCTTLQSFVNVKRNAVRLTTEQGVPDSRALQGASTTSVNDLGPLGVEKLKGTGSTTDVNLLRTSSSFSVLPNLSYAASAAKSTFATLPEPTHTMYFEYDCAAPCASAQIFIRASRKHGSWANFATPAEGLPELLADGSVAMLAQRGPPPHVLGWPVHVAHLRKGFGVRHRAVLPLDLKYFAPPSESTLLRGKATGGAGAEGARDNDLEGKITFSGLLPETPAWDMQRRLELDREDREEQEGEAVAADGAPRTATQQQSRAALAEASNGSGPNATSSSATAEAGAEGTSTSRDPTGAEPEAPETKEQKVAREKSERETLKVSIVVEALDEYARPLKEPNLQTTYLRLNSLPVPKPAATDASATAGERASDAPAVVEDDEAKPRRNWTAQVEGQEAEIGPHRFQLQELYGLSSKPPPVRPAPANADEAEGDAGAHDTNNAALSAMMDESNGTECLICLSAPPTTLLLPCTHGLCLECAVQLRESVMGIRLSERRRGRAPRRKYACPVCRRGFTSMLHLSKADEKLVAQAEAVPAS